jgi:hypothetical protein
MRLDGCPGCGCMVIEWDLKLTPQGLLCQDCIDEWKRVDAVAAEVAVSAGAPVVDIRAFQESKLQEERVKVSQLEAQLEAHGFRHPEDGAEQRYRDRIATKRLSPAMHRFWWFVHNAVAHPLIAAVPRKPFFQFHDWTSRKLHGR